MKNIYNLIFTVALMLSFSANSVGQKTAVSAIETGEQIPNLVFTNVTNSENKEVKLSDYTGKVVILDFWATWCGPCIGTMKRMNSLQEKFSKDVKVILVGNEDKRTIDLFFKNRAKITGRKTSLPSIFSDTILAKYFPHKFIPHTIIINGKGKIIAITSPEEISEDVIRKIIENGSIELFKKTDRYGIDKNEIFYNEKSTKPIFIHRGEFGTQKLRFKSVLTKMIDGEPSVVSPEFGRLLVSHSDIAGLYGAAFNYSFEPFYDNLPRNRIIVETDANDTIMQPRLPRQELREWNKKHMFTYDLLFPEIYEGSDFKKGPDSIRKFACEVMKGDLDSFSGLIGRVERRKVECLVLKCIDSTLINSKTDFGRSENFPGRSGAIYNTPRFRLLFEMLRISLQKQVPLIDETNYHGKLNVKIEADMTNWEAVSEQLRKFGLIITKANREIDMLIIKKKL